jgi:hypothetical protein
MEVYTLDGPGTSLTWALDGHRLLSPGHIWEAPGAAGGRQPRLPGNDE